MRRGDEEKRSRPRVGRHLFIAVTVLAHPSGFDFGSKGLTTKIRVQKWEAGLCRCHRALVLLPQRIEGAATRPHGRQLRFDLPRHKDLKNLRGSPTDRHSGLFSSVLKFIAGKRAGQSIVGGSEQAHSY